MARLRRHSRAAARRPGAAGSRRTLIGGTAVTLVGGSLLAQVIWAGTAVAGTGTASTTSSSASSTSATKTAEQLAHEKLLAKIRAEHEAEAKAKAAARLAHEELLARIRAAHEAAAEARAAAALAHEELLAQVSAAHEAAAAAKAAAQRADAGAIAKAIWQKDGRPARLIVVRPTQLLILSGGTLQQVEARPAGPLSVLWLAENVPGPWMAQPSARVVRLESALVITDGSSLVAPSGDLATLQLTDGAWIQVARGSFAATGIAITSAGASGAGPLPATDPSRPFIRAGAGATLTFDDTTVTGLGNASAPDDAGITWDGGASGNAVAVKVTDGYTGLRLAASTGVTLRDVTVAGSAKDGLVLKDDTGTVLTAVVSENNAGAGVRLLQGPSNRTLTGISTSGNAGYGFDASDISGLTLTGFASSADKTGGVELTGCQNSHVIDAKTWNDRTGIKVGQSSSRVTITDATVTGGRYGVVVGSHAADVTLTGTAVSGTTEYGIDVSGPHVSVSGGSIASGGTGVRIGPGATGAVLDHVTVTKAGQSGISIAAGDATVSQSTVRGARYGIQVYRAPHIVLLSADTVENTQKAIVVAAGASAVRIVNPELAGFTRNAITNSSAGLVVIGGALHGGGTGINTLALMSLTGTRIDQVVEGMHISGAANVKADGAVILAAKTGIVVAAPGHLALSDSTVLASIGIKGDVEYIGSGNVVTLPPFPWFGVVAITAITLGVALETVHVIRQPRRRPTREVAPDHVLNVA